VVEVRPDEDARAVVRRADVQLYEAKRSGRNIIKTAVAAV
jgi:PleD family two-component response regulator